MALWLILALLALIWALPARAGQLDVLGEPDLTPAEGSYGLRVTPGSTCAAPENELFITTSTVSGDKVACDRIIAGTTPGGVATSGDTTFTAGDEIVLREDFTVAHSFAAIISSPLTQWAYVQDNSPAAEKTYNASFYLNLDNLTFGNTTDRLHHFVGYASDGTPWLRIVLRKNGTEKRLVLEMRKDNTTWESTEGGTEVMLPAGWIEISIQWSAGTSGMFEVSLDGENFSGLGPFDNSDGQIDHVRWGAIAGTIDLVTGTLDVDYFSSWR